MEQQLTKRMDVMHATLFGMLEEDLRIQDFANTEGCDFASLVDYVNDRCSTSATALQQYSTYSPSLRKFYSEETQNQYRLKISAIHELQQKLFFAFREEELTPIKLRYFRKGLLMGLLIGLLIYFLYLLL